MRAAGFTTWIMAVLICCNGLSSAQPPEGVPWRMSAELSGFHLVIPEDASPQLKEAGEVFQRLWQAATRRTITVGAVNEGFTNVWLGSGNIPEDLFSVQERDELMPDEFLVRTFVPRRRVGLQGARKQMFITGGTEAAVLQGVYAFFIREMGISWLEPGLLYVPRAAYEIFDIDFSGRPEFLVRRIGLLSCWEKGVDEYRRAYWLSPEASTGPGDPAYFAGYADTEHPACPGNVCVPYGSQDGVLTLFEEIKTARSAADAENSGVLETSCSWETEDETIWLLGAMKQLTAVLSAEGRALNEREGSPAAAILDTANKVAEMLEDAFPAESHRVQVLLSPELQQPPRELRAHPDVIVHLSTAGCNFACPLNDRSCPVNAQFVALVKEWGSVAAHLYVYDYLHNPTDPLLPFPCLDNLQQNILFYLQSGVEGLCFAGVPQGYAAGVNLAALRVFLAARLLLNPDMGVDEAKRLFFEGYYGPASGTVRQHEALLKEKLAVSGASLTIQDDCSWLSDEAVTESLDSFQKVLRQELPDDIRKRIEAVMASMTHLQSLRGKAQSVPGETGGE